jgi:phytoene dehydrogenase-like protein
MNLRGRRKVVIAGAGMAGLTAGAYALRSGHDVLILEKSSECGGLVGSFERDGFLFDTGPRAIGNAGILLPMLEDLGISLPVVKGSVSTGIADRIVHHDSHDDIGGYADSLRALFPESAREIGRIERLSRRYTRMAAVLNRTANPFFRNIPQDLRYLFTELLPWLPSFLSVVIRTDLSRKSIEEVLGSFSKNQALNDMVSQHFFKGTPASFAFGYFENFQDYRYPLGGTGRLPEALVRKIHTGGGRIQNHCEITAVDPAAGIITAGGRDYPCDTLIWAADLRSLYQRLELGGLPERIREPAEKERQACMAARPGESVFTLFLAVNRPPEYFRSISRGHFIYTPRIRGLGGLHRKELDELKAGFSERTRPELFRWLEDYCRYNSYEISIPVLKDPSLAPPGRTGLIISLLFDGELFEMVRRAGWYEEFRLKTMDCMVGNLDESVYPGLKESIVFSDSATPVTLAARFNTADGAITGWSLEEKPPVPYRLSGISGAVKTAVPGVLKAGQWSYSPSGVPIAILTGRLAAGAIRKTAR